MSDQKNTPTPTLDDTPEDTGRGKKGFTDPFDDPLAGEIVEKEPEVIADRYKVLSKLGQGGMGRVYKALDNLLDREVAVKLLNRELGDDQFVRRFQLEAKAASQLKHPNILQVLDFGMTKSGEPYMTMEFVVGQTLDDVLSRNGPFPVDDAIDITIEICKGMQHAHRHRIVHRDLKPSNIMLISNDPERKACVLDFGIAKLETEDQGMLTLTGQIIGSPRCISPEQARGEPLDGRSDIYSLGCVLYEILSGKPPFSGGSAMDTISKHLSEPPPVLPTDKFPAALSEIVDKMLRKNPDDRYASMADIIIALERIERQSEVLPIKLTSPTETKTVVVKKPLNSKFVIGTLLMLALVATSVFAMMSRFRNDAQLDKIGLVDAMSLGDDGKTQSDAGKPPDKSVAENGVNRAVETTNPVPMTTKGVPDIEEKQSEGSRPTAAAKTEKPLDYNDPNLDVDDAINAVGEDYVQRKVSQGLDSSRTAEGLRSDQLKSVVDVTLEKLDETLKEFPNLVCIRVNRGQFTNEMVDLIEQHKTITRVRFDNMKMTDEALARLFRNRKLERIKFADQFVPAQTLSGLKSMPKLDSLQFDRVVVNDVHLQYIGACKKLTYLGIEHTTGPFSANGFKNIAKLKKLEFLDLNYIRLNDDELRILSELPHLRRLIVKGNADIHPETFEYLHQRPLSINVYDCRWFTPAKLNYITKRLGISVLLQGGLTNFDNLGF